MNRYQLICSPDEQSPDVGGLAILLAVFAVFALVGVVGAICERWKARAQ